MAYFGLVTKIQNVRKDPNSDRLYLADCFSEGVIIGPDMKTGDLVLYLPTDGEIERWFGNEFCLFRKNEDGSVQGGYLENNGHVRAIKLRGHTSLEAGYISGAAHALSFDRTATIGSNLLLEKYYGADLENNPPLMGTPSLEHSVVEQGVAWKRAQMFNGELEAEEQALLNTCLSENWEVNLIAEMLFLRHLLINIQPTGTMTYVADTYDYWGVVSKIVPALRDIIEQRDGCLSIRPDSGDPVKIICGDTSFAVDPDSPEGKGTLVSLFDTFGGNLNRKGYFELPSCIRVIYGDAITPEITEKICNWCVNNSISVSNICFGIGAYTYQYVTRDTRGYAIKATDCILGEDEIQIYKMPKTDPGKKSPRGCVAVVKDSEGQYRLVENLTLKEAIEYKDNVMKFKVKDGVFVRENEEDFYTIKNRLMGE